MAQKRKKKRGHKFHKPLIFTSALLVLVAAVALYWFFSVRAPNLPEPPFKVLSQAHGIELGNVAKLNRLKNKPYVNILTSQYSFLTIDGDGDWTYGDGTLRPSPTQYNYTNINKLVSFAKAHNMPIQFHHLVWGEQNFLPDWLKNGNYNSAQLLNIIHEHISNVVGHYRGQIAEYTVVNEAFTRAEHIDGLSDWWADHIGSDIYIDDSFIWAHQADPNAKLLLNDFDNETENNVSNAEYKYAVAAKAKGIPIDGVGMQMHINAADPPSKQAVIENMQRFMAIGLPTYVTEFDINLNSVKGSSLYKSQLESQITYNMVRACIESKACVSFAQIGITDKESLIKQLFNTNSHSFLFNSRYQPKPSFYAFREAWQQP